MAGSRADRERRLLNRLTAIKLAQQILERRTDLTPRQQRLVQTALEACDELTRDLLTTAPDDVRPRNGWSGELALRPGLSDLAAQRTEDRLIWQQSNERVDAIVVAPEQAEREALAAMLRSRGYVVRGSERVDRSVKQLLAERRRLVVLSPDPDVGQAEIEAQVRALRSASPSAAVLVCLGCSQAPRALAGEQLAILRRPFGPRELLARAAELYPVGPPRRVATRRLLS